MKEFIIGILDKLETSEASYADPNNEISKPVKELRLHIDDDNWYTYIPELQWGLGHKSVIDIDGLVKECADRINDRCAAKTHEVTPYMPYSVGFECFMLAPKGIEPIYDIVAGIDFSDASLDSGGIISTARGGFVQGLRGNFRDLSWVKLILRPFTDLNKEITVNGKTFIPIRKMFNILNEGYDLDDLPEGQDWAFNVRDGQYNDVLWEDNQEHTHQFIYLDGHNCFHHRIYGNPRGGIEELNQTNQLQLFQKLFEWHFDVFKLIPRELAIDINTIQVKVK